MASEELEKKKRHVQQYEYLAGWMSGIETGRSWSLSESELQLLWIQGYIFHSPAVSVLKWSNKKENVAERKFLSEMNSH